MTRRQILLRLFALVATIVVSLVFKSVILNGHRLVRLGSAPPLTGSLATSLITSGGKTVLPTEGKDYKITKSRYFYNNGWAVVSVAQASGENETTMVLHKIDGVYQVVIGPGTTFSKSYMLSLPADVGNYLNDQGYLYE